MIFIVLPISINLGCVCVRVCVHTTLWLAYKIFQKENWRNFILLKVLNILIFEEMARVKLGLNPSWKIIEKKWPEKLGKVNKEKRKLAICVTLIPSLKQWDKRNWNI